MKFTGSHILSIGQFERIDIDRIFDVADQMKPYAQRKRVTKVLDGAILGSMFFEPSTRTRVSFGSAFNLLGGEVRETIGFESSAIAKGESPLASPASMKRAMTVNQSPMKDISLAMKRRRNSLFRRSSCM